jgi:hypothetical protein
MKGLRRKAAIAGLAGVVVAGLLVAQRQQDGS